MSHESDDSWWFTTYNCSWTIGHRLRFCLANTLCNGSTWFDLPVHIWNIIDETMVVDYGEVLGSFFSTAGQLQPDRNRNNMSARKLQEYGLACSGVKLVC